MNAPVAAARQIRVLVVDDSALVRRVLRELIEHEPDMKVVGAAPDPLVAREMIRALSPDVITLDVEMPRMDGLEFLERLMRLRPMPVIMVSSITERGSEAALRALELGAVDFVAKPKLDIAGGLREYGQEITEKIRAASTARVRRAPPRLDVGPALSVDAVLAAQPRKVLGTEKVLAVGASTGGTEAILEVLAALPPDCPGVVVTQHMPQAFTRSFAARLDSLCRIRVKEAEGGERVLPGHAYVAPGNAHLLLERSGANYVVRLSDGPPVNRHRPAVDVLFRSVANAAGRNAIGVLLTGMGKDGAAGMLELKQAGAWTIAQDEASCVVYGMPREAVALGAVEESVPLDFIARRVLEKVGRDRAVRV
ncbi:MAG: chemotaxis response regulator protein-glutamate methylesterase [Betaproteobacteria bacterium]|jgi:two-component system chemotaxis response regulator CheB|nr:chemotaxis response regulator protein-glutamate methylesterase [Rhodocyclaceae bacterium]MCA3135068.1 chemotaxis response regulator protein-glutamate methylesterase [Rhodocyclaceae bacterium]MCA3143169.1 chemotaxis response regulator protein-glutamate methylesterase [Rhodocyclaceae bacterium]MCA3146870.1 chemotaxis response regulator protein-glutamate methylesterase [Rhodocyclaceae bacterium]MCE2899039.1 chemotaxis response regulator protein-glutamate methylesterase [Betaproteobacteria bacte